MAIGEIHVDDVGIVFTITIKNENNVVVDLSAATTKEFHFQKPDGSMLIRSGSFVTDGTDGGLQYMTQAGDLDQSGNWKYQIYLVISANVSYTDISKFKVFPNLPL